MKLTWLDIEYLIREAYKEGQESVINTPPWEDLGQDEWENSNVKKALDAMQKEYE